MKRWIVVGSILIAALGVIAGGVWAFGWTDAEEDEATEAPTRLQFVTTSTNMTLEENRFVVTMWQGGEYFNDASAMTVTATNPNGGEPDEVVWQGEAVNYPDYAIPYWVAYPEITAEGLWQFEMTVQLNNGETINGTLLTRVGRDDKGIKAGMAAVASDNVIPANSELPLFRITSDVDPMEELYHLTVTDALASGRPSLISFATPGLCSNKICTPVLDSTIKPLAENFSGEVNVLHVEVYDLATSEFVPAFNEWGLSYEPWTYLVDAEGAVVARWDGPVSVLELTPQIEALLSD
jgi:hypothetical protein